MPDSSPFETGAYDDPQAALGLTPHGAKRHTQQPTPASTVPDWEQKASWIPSPPKNVGAHGTSSPEKSDQGGGKAAAIEGVFTHPGRTIKHVVKAVAAPVGHAFSSAEEFAVKHWEVATGLYADPLVPKAVEEAIRLTPSSVKKEVAKNLDELATVVEKSAVEGARAARKRAPAVGKALLKAAYTTPLAGGVMSVADIVAVVNIPEDELYELEGVGLIVVAAEAPELLPEYLDAVGYLNIEIAAGRAVEQPSSATGMALLVEVLLEGRDKAFAKGLDWAGIPEPVAKAIETEVGVIEFAKAAPKNEAKDTPKKPPTHVTPTYEPVPKAPSKAQKTAAVAAANEDEMLTHGAQVQGNVSSAKRVTSSATQSTHTASQPSAPRTFIPTASVFSPIQEKKEVALAETAQRQDQVLTHGRQLQ